MSEQSFTQGCRRHRHHNFAERLVRGFALAMEHALDAEALGARSGFLQGLDPRTKLVGILALILSGVLTRSLLVLVALFVLALILAFFSHVTLARLAKQVWISVLLFTGVLAVPAMVLVPGHPIWRLPWLHWTVTLQGLRSATFLIGRAETSATFALLLILTTPWTHVLKAMRSLGAPVVLVALLGMTHRYIFVMLQTALQMFEARRSRIVAPMDGAQQRKMVAAAAGVLLNKTFQLSTDVHLAMLSRGYRGEVHLLDEFHTRRSDWIVLFCALAAPVLMYWWQQ
ncbi:cobalt ECF transporter T component CbiQ [Rhodoferax sp.]|uniref:cobalt ECF transporter T component CbiQ n=1 Tax=Rhodoferax sp. TaxID=50421 RepID=UPI00283B8A08|nr:cobalt ECF transporter T component CbiQ [Rhodoferax sp.]MDR3368137.1 cobalt ECF transporter T component CbiQ [Rhodoferax sp.]